MAIESHPQADRHVISARQAARILRRDVRTIRRMIESGALQGGATAGPKQKRWYVYVDQLPPASSEQPTPSATGSDEVADLKAQIVTLQETNRLLSASHALTLAAMEDYKAGAEGFRIAAEGYRQAALKYQSAAEGFHGALEHQRDALAQFTTPGHLGDTAG
ncbi:hypothetical protein H7I77_09990 [Mycolicibacterium novocastrense]|uniref:Helix-turn-helix domain-containing protein n=1 Tax=Mycolicibacterium novocastrense TaxID=59813 RepID=A0AAW5SJU8_MYCNV|nr:MULTISPECIES: hypothetical protein [Mycolicibacterium]MCV7023676.1 hypothetical protein [Mycolicibacterium novocastrense]MDX1886913.1 hypothetical protein [Mycolicibacterium sp. 120270]GAT07678.1 uncharacterized protein RMCN_0811 [Mycolicibacterium novocastrense]